MISARLPFDAALGDVRVTQGNGTLPSHTGLLNWSWDFDVPVGTPILSIADGVVVDYFDSAADGEDGVGRMGNLITIEHAGGYSTLAHLARGSVPDWIKDAVDRGDRPFVAQGTEIGTVGLTGYVIPGEGGDGSHIHITVGATTIPFGASTGHAFPIANGSPEANSATPVRFAEVSGNGLPQQGLTYASQNMLIEPSTGDGLDFLIANLNGRYALYNFDTDDISLTGSFGRQITDVAQGAFGEVYAIDFSRMYRVDIESGETSLLYSLPISNANSLTIFENNGAAQAIIAGGNNWVQFYAETGVEYDRGTLPSGHTAAGDVILLRDDDGRPQEYVFSTTSGGRPHLVRYQFDPVQTVTEEHPVRDLWGLANGLDGEGFFGFAGNAMYGFERDPLVGQSLRNFNDAGLTNISGATRIQPGQTGILDGTGLSLQLFAPNLSTPIGAEYVTTVDPLTPIRDLNALFQGGPAGSRRVEATIEVRDQIVSYTVNENAPGRFAAVDPDTGFNGYSFRFHELADNPAMSLLAAEIVSGGTTLSGFTNEFVFHTEDTLFIDFNGLSYQPGDRVAVRMILNTDIPGGVPQDSMVFGDGFFAAYDLDLGRAVFRLYQATLGREPDAAGQAGWTEGLAMGATTLLGVATGFVSSREFQNTYGALDNVGFVSQLYQNVLGRAPDAGGLAGWVGALEGGQSRAQVVLGLSESQEFINATNRVATEFTLARDPAVWQGDVFRLYQATLGREPDLAGFQGWLTALSEGTPFLTAVNGFVQSREFQNTYGALDDAGFVSLLYQNVLGRDADAAGLAGWVSELASGSSRAEVVRGFAQSAEFIRDTTPALREWIRAQGIDDVLNGGPGMNELWGGPMADVFRFQQADSGMHRVQDLEPWDYLDFRGFGFTTSEDALSRMVQLGNDVVFANQGTTVILANTQLASLDADMFIFG